MYKINRGCQVNILHYSKVISLLRKFFFEHKKFIEVPAQARLSILAACEDPETIAKFNFDDIDWPLPQTGQMQLEHDLLKNPHLPGLFCITTSYRNEPNPISGRHDKIFPMFEFEAPGTIDDLCALEKELVEFLGFQKPVSVTYADLCKKYDTENLEWEHEELMEKEFGNAVSLEYFPQRSHPFWNMKHAYDDIFKKIDIILAGIETIGSAERETDIERMRDNFFSISEGKYAALLFEHFSKERVMAELEEYFNLPMIPRFGAGIGITRLIKGMIKYNLL